MYVLSIPLHFLPPLQLPDSIYLVTEEAVPLEEHHSTQDGHSEFSTAWGLHQVLVREEGEERGGGQGVEGRRWRKVEEKCFSYPPLLLPSYFRKPSVSCQTTVD